MRPSPNHHLTKDHTHLEHVVSVCHGAIANLVSATCSYMLICVDRCRRIEI